MAETPRLPSEDEHVAIAGRTGSGKTVAALDMLSRRDFGSRAWFIVDHKGDENIKSLKLEKIPLDKKILPDKGLFHVPFRFGKDPAWKLEEFLVRAFKKTKTGIFVDEGHLLAKSPMIRTILVAGRQKRVTIMWCSQRAAWIDPFIWSQASIYRVFDLQTAPDVKRFNENFPSKYEKLPEFHSHYYDVKRGKLWKLAPSKVMRDIKETLDTKLFQGYTSI